MFEPIPLTEAIDRLEEFQRLLNGMVERLREDRPGHRYAHAFVYGVRTELSHIVRDMGYQSPGGYLRDEILREIESIRKEVESTRKGD